MTRYSLEVDSRLDELAAEARARLAAIPGQPTSTEVVEEMFRAMVTAFGGGYHPDTLGDEYESFPEGYDHELVSAIEDQAMEHGADLYGLALEAHDHMRLA